MGLRQQGTLLRRGTENWSALMLTFAVFLVSDSRHFCLSACWLAGLLACLPNFFHTSPKTSVAARGKEFQNSAAARGSEF